jgi:homoaconitase/3-isopropylmalate dehydratase large subunit
MEGDDLSIVVFRCIQEMDIDNRMSICNLSLLTIVHLSF